VPTAAMRAAYPKGDAPGAINNYHAADIAIATMYCYEALTGRRATVLTDGIRIAPTDLISIW
jgi:hypothetical protein